MWKEREQYGFESLLWPNRKMKGCSPYMHTSSMTDQKRYLKKSVKTSTAAVFFFYINSVKNLLRWRQRLQKQRCFTCDGRQKHRANKLCGPEKLMKTVKWSGGGRTARLSRGGALHGDDRGINGPNVPGSIAVGDAGVDIIVSRNNSGDKLRCCCAAGHHHLTAARWVNVSGHDTHNRGRTGRLDVAMLQKRP